jgi:hypothetical protein
VQSRRSQRQNEIRSQQRCDIGKDRKVAPSPSRLNWLQYNPDTPDPSKCTSITLSLPTRVHPSMPPTTSQFDRPQASPSSQSDDTPNSTHHGGLSHTSIALICAFVVCFAFFLYISSKKPRISEPVRASSARPRRSAPRRPRPKLWDIWLDEDHPDELKPPRRTACNWRVSSPMLITKESQ